MVFTCVLIVWVNHHRQHSFDMLYYQAMNTTLPYRVGDPPARLKKARLDNIALVPASLLPLKGTYQPIANTLPNGSVLCVPGTQKQQKIMATVTKFFHDH